MIDPTQYDTSGPGKFEAEPPETRYYYEQMLEGDGEDIHLDIYSEHDEQPIVATVFHITSEESDAFGLADARIYMIHEDSQGFVYGTTHPNLEHAERTFRKWLGL